MSTVSIGIRRASWSDASQIAGVHDEAWRTAYRGIIPGRELEKLILRRGPGWWARAIDRGLGIMVLEFDNAIAGYSTYGRNRARSLPFAGEIYEFYLAPVFQGVGLGKRLFAATRAQLARHHLTSHIAWALADNTQAIGFYTRLGGREIARGSERFNERELVKIAFGWEG